MRATVRLFLAIAMVVLPPATARAQWTPDGVPLCTAPGAQSNPIVIPDGTGGGIITWRDSRASSADIYSQRIDGSGSALWAANGVPICTEPHDQGSPVAIPDGNGGAFIAWVDGRDSRVYLQHITSAGSVVAGWPQDGLRVTTSPYPQSEPSLVGDASGGGFVACIERLTDQSMRIVCQRLTPTGSVSVGWPAGGFVLDHGFPAQHEYSESFYSVRLVSDGRGGAIAAWWDEGVSCSPGYGCSFSDKIAFTGVSALGALRFRGGARDLRGIPAIAPDDSGGFIGCAETPFSTGVFPDIAACRVLANGIVGWQTPLSTAPFSQYSPAVAADGTGGFFCVWIGDRMYRYEPVLYASHLGATGALKPGWLSGGTPICRASPEQRSPLVVAVPNGGGAFCWQDLRNGNWDIYAQIVTAAGQIAAGWVADGVPLCKAPGDQVSPSMTAVGAGGAIVAWQDGRSGQSDIYAQAIRFDALVPTQLSLVSAEATPTEVRLRWYADLTSDATVYRRQENSEWTPLSTINSDGTSYLSYVDHAVVPGARYGYRLGIGTGQAEWRSAENWVQVPSAPLLALEGLRPNPCTGPAWISFSLPTAAPAALDVLDLHGRRIAHREVGLLGAGGHTVVFEEAEGLAPGVYLLRLVQGDRMKTTRAVLFH